MARTNFESVDEYIASRPESVRGILGRVRNAIRKALPGAEEMISYQIPAYRVHSRIVIYFAAWKEHYSLYPATGGLAAALREELAPYKLSKGVIRFPLSQSVPVKLIERIAKFRAKEVAERQKAKTATPKKRQGPGSDAASTPSPAGRTIFVRPSEGGGAMHRGCGLVTRSPHWNLRL